jgi:hypothetical protein
MKRAALAVVAVLAGCGGASANAVTPYFDLDGPIDTFSTFYNLPFPSDLRLDGTGAPDVTGYPNGQNAVLLQQLLTLAPLHHGWPQMPIAYVRFTQPVAARSVLDVIAPGPDAPVMLIDIDPTSPEKGSAYPVIAQTLVEDSYTSSNVVALAPRPGIVLRASTQYAYVVRTSFSPGLAPADDFATLAAGGTPSAMRGSAAAALYAPLWPALEAADIPAHDVAVATVFTTGDEMATLKARSDAILALGHPAITGLSVVNGDTYSGFCRLDGTITMPQFQTGTQPFDTGGVFVLDGSGVPIQQGSMTIPVVITLPKQMMPANGWPLYQWFHGSGGLSSAVVDAGPSLTPADMETPGQGPGFVVALHGIAAASSALPLNPERLPGASDYAYLNLNNLAAFPFTFEQGVIEQRLFTDALLDLQIDPSVVAACTGLAAPAGATHHFDPASLMAGGQSMGGMYTNLFGAVEPRFPALVPTGAGGFWNLMILETQAVPGARTLLTAALSVDNNSFTFLHPALNAMALGWEIAEPIVAMSRIAHRPLPGMPVHHVYEPIGIGDSFFSTDVYDAAALSYQNQEAGSAVWPTTQEALALSNLQGLLPYPVTGNQDAHTRVVIQYEGDGIIDPHQIFRQLDVVKHQYGCFLQTYLSNGTPTVFGSGAIDDPCE